MIEDKKKETLIERMDRRELEMNVLFAIIVALGAIVITLSVGAIVEVVI